MQSTCVTIPYNHEGDFRLHHAFLTLLITLPSRGIYFDYLSEYSIVFYLHLDLLTGLSRWFLKKFRRLGGVFVKCDRNIVYIGIIGYLFSFFHLYTTPRAIQLSFHNASLPLATCCFDRSVYVLHPLHY